MGGKDGRVRLANLSLLRNFRGFRADLHVDPVGTRALGYGTIVILVDGRCAKVNFPQMKKSVCKAPQQRLKRVIAIDQFSVVDGLRHGNERRHVIPTQARALAGQWTRVALLDRDEQVLRHPTGQDLLTTVPEELVAFEVAIFGSSGIDAQGGELVTVDLSARA